MQDETIEQLSEEQKSKIKIIKKELKAWESEFIQVNGRKPNKSDIAKVPEIEIRYKAYSKLKKMETGYGSTEDINRKPVKQPQNHRIVSKNPPQDLDADTSKPRAVYNERAEGVSSTTNILAGPISKADVGQQVNKFAKRLQEQQKQKEEQKPEDKIEIKIYQSSQKPEADNEITFQSSQLQTSDPVPGGEIGEFFERKNQINAITTSNQISVQLESHNIPSIDREGSFTEAVSFGKPEVKQGNSPLVISVGGLTTEYLADAKIDSAKDLSRPKKIELPSLSKNKELSPDKRALPGIRSQIPPVAEEKEQRQRPSVAEEKEQRQRPSVAEEKEVRQTPSTIEEESKPNSQTIEKQQIEEDGVQDIEIEGDAKQMIIPAEQIDDPTTEKTAGEAKSPNSEGNVKFLPSLLVTDLFRRCEKGGVLRCRFTRKKFLLGKGPPTYLVHNEADNSFLMAAKRILLSKQVHYVISDHPDDFEKGSIHYKAKLKYRKLIRANFMRTVFILSDCRQIGSPSEIGFISYSKHVLPREIKAAILAPKEGDQENNERITDIAEEFRMQNVDKLLFLRNKPPRWNENTQSHCLNFGGRVTQPSIKNMQLISDLTGVSILLFT